MRKAIRFSGLLLIVTCFPAAVIAHSGPPFPIISDRIVGNYRVSIWTDPDTTDDSRPGGQFWVRLDTTRGEASVPGSTRATVVIRPVDRPGAPLTASATPVRGDTTNQFAALRMDHEGPFAVHIAIDGPLGRAALDSEVMATYDLRPPAYLLGLYLAPFVLVGLLWGRLMMRRRNAGRGSSKR